MSNEELEILYSGESRALSFGQSRMDGAWVRQSLERPEDLEVFKAMDSDDMNKAKFILNATVTLWDITVEASEGHQKVYHGEIQYLGYGESVKDGAWIKWGILDSDELQPYRDLGKEKKLSKTAMKLVISRGDIIPAEDESAPELKIYGKQARVLFQSNVLVTPQVIKHIGTDDEFAQYLREQKCIVCGKGDWVEDIGDYRSDPAHVRRANTDGTAYKGPYTPRVPLCREHHNYQHSQGWAKLEVLQEFLKNGTNKLAMPDKDAMEWAASKGYQYLHDWARTALKLTLNFSSWSEVPPQVLREWWNEHGLPITMLPHVYRA